MIKQATCLDAGVLAELAIQMWDSHTLSDLEKDFLNILGSKNSACFIKYSDDQPIGFAQCQLRHDYVEGTETSPVGYLEGIFVKAEFRRKGFAKELLMECESWAKEKKCCEFASDCELSNTDSLRFHMAVGFEEANRIICFRKDL